MEHLRRWAPLGIAVLLTLAMQLDLVKRFSTASRSKSARVIAWTAFALSIIWIGVGTGAAVNRLSRLYPPNLGTWLHASALGWMVVTACAYFWIRTAAATPVDPAKRRWIRTAVSSAAVAPALVAGYGIFVERSRVRLETIDLKVPDLPPDLDGLRIAQISDVHLGPFLSVRELDAAVGMLNESKPHLAVMTGDLISRRGDPLDLGLLSLSRLKADAGIFGCLGNHERYARAEDYTCDKAARLGIHFLRRESRRIRFGAASLNLVGFDYQRMRPDRVYLPNGGRLVHSESFNVLLSHNPDVFPSAADLGFELTLSGHTHGGQVNVEILDENWNVARFYTPYTSGLYRRETSSIYVNRGLGTIGLPMRIGAPPEVTVIRLCAA